MQRAVAVREPLGALMPGPRPLEGKSFYLDEVKSHSCGVLTKLIIRLGGVNITSCTNQGCDVRQYM